MFSQSVDTGFLGFHKFAMGFKAAKAAASATNIIENANVDHFLDAIKRSLFHRLTCSGSAYQFFALRAARTVGKLPGHSGPKVFARLRTGQ
jgi:hypothetical protein